MTQTSGGAVQVTGLINFPVDDVPRFLRIGDP